MTDREFLYMLLGTLSAPSVPDTEALKDSIRIQLKTGAPPQDKPQVCPPRMDYAAR